MFLGQTGCVQSDVQSLNTTIVEGSIERHKARLASRETVRQATGPPAKIVGGAWTGPKRCRNSRESAVRVHAWRMPLDGTNPCSREASTVHSVQKVVDVIQSYQCPNTHSCFGQGCTKRVICNFNLAIYLVLGKSELLLVSSTATRAHMNWKLSLLYGFCISTIYSSILFKVEKRWL